MIEQRCPLYDIYFIEFCAFEQVEIPSERLMRMTFDTQTKVYNGNERQHSLLFLR